MSTDARPTAGLEVEPVVTTTPPPAALVARSTGADLLVVGSRGRGGFRGRLMGSVSLQCVLPAHCPVTVVRPEQHAREAAGAALDAHHDVRREAATTAG